MCTDNSRFEAALLTFRPLGTFFLAVLCLVPGRVNASVVTVPDDYASIQAAIDVGADTVFVRDGEYAEILQAYRGITLLGLGSPRPRLAGLVISNPHGALSRRWNISDIDIMGPVSIQTLNPGARMLDITFSNCRLVEGFRHTTTDPYDIRTLSLSHCLLGGPSEGRAAILEMHADTATAGVSFAAEESATVDSCWFRGGAKHALNLGLNDQASGSIVGNVFEDAPKGLCLLGIYEATIRRNVVRRASAIGIELEGRRVLLRENEISDCGVGMRVGFGEATLLDNRIVDTANTGVYLDVMSGIRVERNQIGKCGGSAIFVQFAYDAELRFAQNSLFDVGGSGIVITDGVNNILTVEENIGFGAAGYGLQVHASSFLSTTLRCNDWFANGLGAVYGLMASAQDYALDPGFCDLANGDVGLYSDSPLVGQAECAQIGARGIGCHPPKLKTLTVVSSSPGLAVDWVFEAASSVDNWVERADQARGPWDSLGTGAPSGNNTFALVDPAVAPDRVYHYRVAWRDRGAVVYGSSVLGTWVDAGRLSTVAPNPAVGEVGVEWILAQPGATDIRIFDLAGREVAVVARGTFDVGRHHVRWDGRWEGRGGAPAGMYIVRVSSNDRTTSHRVLLLR